MSERIDEKPLAASIALTDLVLGSSSAGVMKKISPRTLAEFVKNDEVNVKWFGALPANADNQPQIQSAIDFAIANNISNVYVPSGTYNISKGILIMSLIANTQVNINFYGAKKSTTMAHGETVLNVTGNDSFGIGAQLAKGVTISNFGIRGVNQLNYSVTTGWTAATTYKVAGVRDNRYSPYAGVVFDPFHTNVGAGDRYPGFTSNYALVTTGGGSTDCRVTDVFIDGFVVGRVLSPNGTTQNNESHVFDSNWISNCRESYVSCNSQERNILIRNDKIWNSVQTCYANQVYGAQFGDPPFVEGSNIAGGIFEIFSIQGVGYSPYFIARDIHAESFYRLGTVGCRASIENCKFHLGAVTEFGLKTPAWHFLTWSKVVFKSCFIFNYNNTPSLPFRIYSGDFRFNPVLNFVDCLISPPTYSGHTTSEVGYDEYLSNGFNFSGTTSFYEIGGSILEKPLLTGAFNYSASENYLLQPGSEILYGLGTYDGYSNKRCIIHKVTSPIMKHGHPNAGLVPVVVTGTNATFDIDHVNAGVLKATLQVGDPMFSNETLTDQFGQSFVGNQIGLITSIDGSTVTIGFIVDGFNSGDRGLYCNLFLQRFVSPVYGTTTSGSNVITNCYGHTLDVGHKLDMSYIFARGCYITAISGDTITVSSNSAVTGNNVLVTSYDFIETGYTWGEPIASFAGFGDGITCRKGTVLQDTYHGSTESTWTCTKSGTFGTANPPTFISNSLIDNNALIDA